MKLKSTRLLVAGALVLSLSACAPAAETSPSPALPAEALTETVSPSPAVSPEAAPTQTTPLETPPAEAVSPEPEESTPVQTAETWLEAYHILFEDLERSISQEELELYGDQWREAVIYDVDQNDIPELFLKSGYCEADFETVCYAFRNGRAEAIGQFQSGHTYLYSADPDRGSVLAWEAHMGYSNIYEYCIADGQLICLRTVFSEGYVPAYLPYRDITDFFPEAQPLTQYFGTYSEIWDGIFADWSEQI